MHQKKKKNKKKIKNCDVKIFKDTIEVKSISISLNNIILWPPLQPEKYRDSQYGDPMAAP